MVLCYDGSGFQGWQRQPHGPSVQGALEDALRLCLRRSIAVHGAGRTDSGVHAFGQVAHVDLPAEAATPEELRRLARRLEGICLRRVGVRALYRMPADFHARHSACGKVYRYQVHDAAYPPVLAEGRTWWLRGRSSLDLAAMRRAAAYLEGTHDFSAFRAAACEARSPRQTVHAIRIFRRPWTRGRACV